MEKILKIGGAIVGFLTLFATLCMAWQSTQSDLASQKNDTAILRSDLEEVAEKQAADHDKITEIHSDVKWMKGEMQKRVP